MSNLPVVTIAIPTFKRSHFLERTLNSVAMQDYPNLEVLIADNDPNDQESVLVVERFKKVIPNITYFKHSKNIGSIGNFFFC
ncbi:glycosyltransferase family 2 protein [Cylindrospermopsis raciborskii]|uniref:glycosyltransferase family 2 protein n=1 Tax=Cylindrospermopsis raciborskii TaxID=77022 RepID=UPI003DA2F0C6